MRKMLNEICACMVMQVNLARGIGAVSNGLPDF